jgi:hypothetical protein
MSVIGRLDEQVNDIIISPLERERRSRTDAEPEAQDERANTEGALSNPPTRNPPSGSIHKSSQHAPSDRDELPVWLL